MSYRYNTILLLCSKCRFGVWYVSPDATKIWNENKSMEEHYEVISCDDVLCVSAIAFFFAVVADA